MRRIIVGLALSLCGGMALAQTPPAPPPGVAAAPSVQSAPGMQATPPAPSAMPALPAPGGPPEGMVVETPSGFYLVRPGETAPHRIDLGQGGQRPPGMAQGGPGGDMDDMADEGMQPPPHPRRPPPHPPEGKGARFRIQSPNLTVGVKCPDDEPIKACVDAVSQLLDKTSAQAH